MSRFAAYMLLLAGLSATGAAHAAGVAGPEEIAGSVLPAVVSISSLRVAGVTAGISQSAAAPAAVSHRARLLGSGFIIDPAGIIATNRHVVEGTTDILVTLQDNTLLRARLIAQSDELDLALLAVTPEAPLPAVKFGDSEAVRVADRVLAIGNPLSLGGSVSEGIVSALNRDIRDTPFDDFIQTDAAINHGNSGGPLFNMQGEVIGMNTAIFSPEATSGSIGLGFAIPSNDVKYVAEALRQPGGERPGTLDFRIQQVTPEIADALNMQKAEGVIVGGTSEGGGASACGIVAGDIILRYGDMAVKDVRALARAIARTPPGTIVKLLVLHDQEPEMIAATVQTHPPPPRPAPQFVASAAPADPGWRLVSIDDTSRNVFGLDRTKTGVVVTEIASDGAAAEAGLSPGDVIVQVQQEKIAAPADVTRAVAAARSQQRRYVIVLVQNTEGMRWLALSLM